MNSSNVPNQEDAAVLPRPMRGRAAVLCLTVVCTAGLLAAIVFFPPEGQTKGNMYRLLGRLHPLIVHLPVALLPLALLFEALGMFGRFDHLKRTAGFVLGLGALAAVGATAHGYLLARSDGYEATSLLNWHMWTGIAVAIMAMVCWTLRVYAPGRRWLGGLYCLSLTCTVGTLAVAAHFGGSLTHGEDYLTEFLPPSIRAQLGIQLHKKAGSGTNTLADTRPATPPTVYAAIIAPALERHCVQCHGPAKIKGGLRLDSLEHIGKGGKAGSAIMPKDAGGSELHRRITLASDDDDYMPPDGKPPLPSDVVLVIGWWIQDGASGERAVADLKSAPPEIQEAAARLKSGK